MDFRILGPVEAREQDRAIPLGGPRQRALLALLLLHRNTPVTTERLIDDLWGDDPPRSGAQAVQNLVLRLRKALGPDRVLTRGGGYEVRVEEGELDLDRVERLVARAAGGDAEWRTASLCEALAEFRGAPLADVGADFPTAEAARLDDLRLATLEDRVDADLELGRHAELVSELAILAAEEPLRERVRAQLILALYRSGRQAEALDAYRETRRMLADDLGLEPGPALRELERAILRQDPLLDPPAPRAARTAEGRPARRRVVPAAAGLALALVGGLAAYAVARGSPETAGLAAVSSTGRPGPPPSTARRGTPVNVLRTVTSTSGRTSKAKQVTSVGKPRPVLPTSIAAKVATTAATTERAPVTTAPTKQAPKRPAPPPTTSASTTRAATTPATTAAGTTTTTTPRTPAASVRITDDFAEDYRDGTIWHQIVTGTSVDIRPQDGRLVVSIGADATPGGPYDVIDGHYGTQCSFPGDFDARIDFDLLDWPDGGGVSAGLWAFFADTAVVRQSGKWGDQYAAWVVPANGGTSLPDRSGSFRLARVGGTITAYFWHDGSWRTLVSGVDRGAAVIGPSAQAARDDFGHAAVRVAFDNFSVEARELSCPPGSTPPAKP
jgi:DNA-binding SARP family transcriptional activator